MDNLLKLKEVIGDSNILRKRHILREGFVFTAITYPGNVYDALVIRNPIDAKCSSPLMGRSVHTLEEHIDFVNRFGIEKALVIGKSIDFIAKCPTLKYLQIIPSDDADNKFDYSPLEQLSEIKFLNCSTVYGTREELSTCIDYSNLNGIEDVSIGASGHKNYNSLSTLKSLNISGYKDSDLTNMFCSSILDSLMIITSRIKTLEGIQRTQNLKCLYLYYNRTLQDISQLKSAKNTLTALRIENCPKIEDFSVLGELENLQLLDLRGSNVLPNLSFLKTMKNLKTLIIGMNVLDGDLSLCTNLSYVYSISNRKHYNIKDSELPKGEYVRGNDSIDVWRRHQ